MSCCFENMEGLLVLISVWMGAVTLAYINTEKALFTLNWGRFAVTEKFLKSHRDRESSLCG